ncbi:MAG TPA: sigma-70 family RNA polymerase sigma factor [Gaiellaceae bacterium]
MDGTEELDQRGAELLAELAADPESECWRQFDALYYELVWRYLKASHPVLSGRVARYLRVDGLVAPDVLNSEVADVAHEATLVALRRVRENAGRFDPDQGTATSWVIGAAEFAWVDVAKTIASARRSDDLYAGPDDLLAVADPSPTTEEHVLQHLEDAEALVDAASHLSANEWAAVRLVITAGYSYAETAKLIFGDETKTKQVDGLLQRGKAKLADAWKSRKPSTSGAGGANLADRTDDKEGSNG